ncbi:MAG: bifunctional folylpolyglutamate synthase/dihydrofolate synthase [Clostridiales bacterium]|jgi:dihydrofolate synthase/folylpolyglutamate synthase|nr:bifunctional folylpolyglutamate synthase/dihydrofolate synthase [Clostridiales bacterium]
MNFSQAKEFLDKFDKSKIKPGLERITALLHKLGDPQQRQKVIHVAGTNGKGSVCKYIESVLTKSGLKVGIFTSPYLTKINQCFRIERDIDDDEFASCTQKIANVLLQDELLKSQVSRFEIVTALAFLYFKDRCDCVILETGLGGIFDSTNVIDNPLLTVITKISYDHMDFLGDSIQSIAKNKAGIIKKNVNVIVAPQDYKQAIDTIKCVATTKNSKCTLVGVDNKIAVHADKTFDYCGIKSLFTPLNGRHQIDNAATAVQSCIELSKVFDISTSHILDGISSTVWECRLEKVHQKPIVYIDGAHNEDGVESMLQFLQTEHRDSKIIFIFGVLRDKSYSKFIDMIAEFAKVVFTVTPDSPRALSCEILAQEIIKKNIKAVSCNTLQKAIQDAFLSTNEKDIIVVFGSLYMVGHAREEILNTVNVG